MIELGRRGVGQQVIVTAVAVDDDDFLAAVARHLIGGFLKQFQLEFQTVGDRAGLVLGLKNLTEVVLGKNHRVFLRGGVQRRIAHVQEVRAQGRSEEHTSELQSLAYLVCRLLLEKKKI